MRNPNLRWDKIGYILFFFIAALVVFADQFTKAWIRTHLMRGQTFFDIGFFQIVHVQNTGAAFGLFPFLTAVLTVVSFIGVVVILVCVFFLPRHLSFLYTIGAKSGLGLVLGGTVGNLIDRLRLGYVTDFLNFNFWPAFNIADSAVTIGTLCLVYLFLHQGLNEARHGR